MPVCVPLKQSQLTSLQANQSRLVTKVRYKIEVVNGILKRNKLLNNKKFNSTLGDGLDDRKIAAAIFNEFFTPIESDQESSIFIAQRMRALLNTDCKFLELVPQLDRKRSIWKKMDQNVLADFPILDRHNIMFFTLGSYQIKTLQVLCGRAHF